MGDGEGLAVQEVVAEVGSGLDGKRAKLRRLLADPQVATIVVEHRDRLARFGVEDAEVADDLVRNMVEVLTSFRARVYGRRSARRQAQAALVTTQSEVAA
jgi:putative resolvase